MPELTEHQTAFQRQLALDLAPVWAFAAYCH